MRKEELSAFELMYYDGSQRKIRVYVPAHEEGETFPVIYMTDGQNLFDEVPEQYGCWHTREAVEEERARSGKAAIIVGIHNDCSPMQRTNELTPKSIGKIIFPDDFPEALKKMMDPQGERFDDFVVNTVIPAVEARFPVKKDRENTAFCGSSSGGLQSFFTALSHPDRFGYAGVLSSCFVLYDREDLNRWIRSVITDSKPLLYLYSGGTGELEEQICQSVEWTIYVLKTCYPPELMVSVIKPEQPHHESAWEPVFKDFLHIFVNGKSE